MGQSLALLQKPKRGRQDHLAAGDDRIQIDPLVTLMVVACQRSIDDTRNAGLTIDEVTIAQPGGIAQWHRCSKHRLACLGKRAGKRMLGHVPYERRIEGWLNGELEMRW